MAKASKSKSSKPAQAKPSSVPLPVKTVYGVPQYASNPSRPNANKSSVQALNLSSAGHRVFALLYLLMLDNPKKDTLYLHFSAVPKPEMISLTTFKAGIAELLAKEVIYRSVQDYTYFVNVNYLIKQ